MTYLGSWCLDGLAIFLKPFFPRWVEQKNWRIDGTGYNNFVIALDYYLKGKFRHNASSRFFCNSSGIYTRKKCNRQRWTITIHEFVKSPNCVIGYGLCYHFTNWTLGHNTLQYADHFFQFYALLLKCGIYRSSYTFFLNLLKMWPRCVNV